MTKSLAILALADGTTFRGTAFGAVRGVDNPVVGEVVFNTSMLGYQEILTDPSYAGQIMCFAAPQIGNMGCNPEDDESERVFAEGLICRQQSLRPSNFRATESLSEYLEKRGVMGLEGIDTRALVLHLRKHGAMMGAFSVGDSATDAATLVAAAQGAGSMLGKDYVHAVSCKEVYAWTEGAWRLGHGFTKPTSADLAARPHVVAIDCGIKRTILRLLTDVGFRVTVVPCDTKPALIRALKPAGLFLSNGPGDPATLGGIVATVKDLLGEVPMFGICLGHQLLGQAVGGKTYKLKFGHRGGNHPVRDEQGGRVEITVQNHGFAVDPESLPRNVRVSHRNLNDGTVEGLWVEGAQAFSVQYHPEASPGPHDAGYLFRRFFNLVTMGEAASRSNGETPPPRSWERQGAQACA